MRSGARLCRAGQTPYHAFVISPKEDTCRYGTDRHRCALAQALEAQFTDVGAGAVIGYTRLVRSRLPAKVRWTDYPLVGGPYWRAGDLRVGFGREPDLDPASAASGEAVRHLMDAEAWVFAGTAEADDVFRLLSLFPEGTPRLGVFFWDVSGLRPFAASEREASALCAARQPLDRFQWAYEANMRALGQRALDAAFAPGAAPGAGVITGLWPVQILFALRRLEEGCWEGGPVPPGHRQEALYPAAFPGAVIVPEWRNPGLGTVERSHGVVSEWEAWRLFWPGTGRWAACDGRWGPWRDYESFERACAGLVTHGLAEMPPSPLCKVEREPARLTAAGRALLEILPSEMQDPDMLLRWRGGPDGLPRDEDVPAMDRWLNSVFRKLKRRLNELMPPRPDDHRDSLPDASLGS